MLVPDIKSVNTDKNNSYTIYVEDDGSPNGSMYNYEILTDNKEKDKFVKSIEKIIRQSYEYKNFIGILKNVYGYTNSTFFKRIDIRDTKTPIEFHHYPFTLYDLVSIEVDFEIDKGETEIDPIKIAERVMKYHYQLIVGLVPLSETEHELVHDGKKFVNIDEVKGDFEAYLEKFDHKIPDEFKEKIQNLKYLSKQENEGVDIDGNILELNFLSVINEDTDDEGLYYLEMDESEKKTPEALNGEYSEKELEEYSNEDISEIIEEEPKDKPKKKKKHKKRGND